MSLLNTCQHNYTTQGSNRLGLLASLPTVPLCIPSVSHLSSFLTSYTTITITCPQLINYVTFSLIVHSETQEK